MAIFLLGLDAASAKRVALVIGNAAYQNQELESIPTAGSDARLIARTLTQIGFDQVTVGLDMDRDEMLAALATFASDARGADAAIIYYAGHGFVIGGQNRLVPVNARLSSAEGVASETISINDVVGALDQASGLRILVLDAAHAGRPATQRRGATAWRARLNITGALASVEIANVLILYSAKAGSLVPAGDAGTGTFAELLATALTEPGLEVRQLLSRVREDVLRVTRGQQEPFVYGTLSGVAAYLLPPTPESSRTDAERQAWTRASAADTEVAYGDYLRQFPQGANWTQAANARALRRAQRIRAGPTGYDGRVINIAADGTGDYRTLSDAVRAAQDGDRIVLGPGRHQTSLVSVYKSILITGPRRGTAIIDFAEYGLTVRGASPYSNNRALTRAPNTAVETLPRFWLEKVEIRCTCDPVTLLSGQTTMHDVHIFAFPPPGQSLATGVTLSSAADLWIVDSQIEAPYAPIKLRGGMLTAVGNRLRVTSTGREGAARAVISGTLAFGLASLVENRLEGVGMIGFFINTGPYLFSNNEFVVSGVSGGSYILFGVASQMRPIVVRNNRVRVGRGRAIWSECTASPCALTLDGNRGLSEEATK